MARIFTSLMIAEIVQRANNGMSAKEIARDLGLNLGSLRVNASNLGISLRKRRAAHAQNTRTLRVVVSNQALTRLRGWSAAKGLSVEGLAAELLAVIASDGLCAAILDDDTDNSLRTPVAIASHQYGTR